MNQSVNQVVWDESSRQRFNELVSRYGTDSRAIFDNWHDTPRVLESGELVQQSPVTLKMIQNRISNTNRDLRKRGLNTITTQQLQIAKHFFQVQWQYSTNLASTLARCITTSNGEIAEKYMWKKRRLDSPTCSPSPHPTPPSLQQVPILNPANPQPAYPTPFSPAHPETSFQQVYPEHPYHTQNPFQTSPFPPQSPTQPQGPFPHSPFQPQSPFPQNLFQPHPFLTPQHQPPIHEVPQVPVDRGAMKRKREEERARRDSMTNTTGISLQKCQYPKASIALSPDHRSEWDSPRAPPRWHNKSEGSSDELATVFNMIDNSLVSADKLPSFNDVKGSNEIKESLFDSLIAAQHFSGEVNNVLFYGPPGTGKTMLALAIAKDMGMNVLLITPASVSSSFKGRSEMICKAIFQRAEEYSPCLVFFDEAEAILGERSSNDQHHSEKSTLLSYFESSVRSKTAKVFIVAATNLPWKIDQAFLRRFHMKFYVPLPTVSDISSLLLHLTETPSNPNIIYCQEIDVNKIAEILYARKFSNADVCTIFKKRLPNIALSRSPFWKTVREDVRNGKIPTLPEKVKVTEELLLSIIAEYEGHTAPRDEILQEYTHGSWIDK